MAGAGPAAGPNVKVQDAGYLLLCLVIVRIANPDHRAKLSIALLPSRLTECSAVSVTPGPRVGAVDDTKGEGGVGCPGWSSSRVRRESRSMSANSVKTAHEPDSRSSTGTATRARTRGRIRVVSAAEALPGRAARSSGIARAASTVALSQEPPPLAGATGVGIRDRAGNGAAWRSAMRQEHKRDRLLRHVRARPQRVVVVYGFYARLCC